MLAAHQRPRQWASTWVWITRKKQLVIYGTRKLLQIFGVTGKPSVTAPIPGDDAPRVVEYARNYGDCPGSCEQVYSIRTSRASGFPQGQLLVAEAPPDSVAARPVAGPGPANQHGRAAAGNDRL
jgi:hypothetical protein